MGWGFGAPIHPHPFPRQTERMGTDGNGWERHPNSTPLRPACMSKRAASITRHLLADLCLDCAATLLRGPDAEAERIALHLVGVADGSAWSTLAALTSKPGRVPEARRILAELVRGNVAAACRIDAQAPNEAG